MKTETKPETALAKSAAEEPLLSTLFRDSWPSEEWFRPLLPVNGSPWSLLRQMEEKFGPSAFAPLTAALPRIDVSETDDEWLVEAEIPGVRQEDIEVEVRDSVLYLQAQSQQETTEETPGTNGNRRYYRRERRSSRVERALRLPDGVDEAKISCDYKDGILRCHLPKKPGATSPSRRIPVGQT